MTVDGTKQLIVDNNSISDAAYGLYSTIQEAIDAAQPGQTILINSGEYEEDLTLKAGVNLSAIGSSGFTPNVTILGKCSFSAAGFVTITGICLKTNGNFAISVTGNASSSLYLVDCNIIAEDFAAIEMTSTGTSPRIRIVNSWCRTNGGASGTNFFQVSGTGGLTFWNVNVIDNDTPQAMPSTFSSSGGLLVKYSIIRFPIATSGTGRISATDSEFNTFQLNSTPLDISATAVSFRNYLRGCILISGTNTALNVGAGVTLNMLGCTVVSDTTFPVVPTTGTGTLRQSGTSYLFDDPISSATTLTLERKAFDPGALWGNWSGVAPAAGYLGEHLRQTRASPGIALTTATPTNVTATALTLTPGT